MRDLRPEEYPQASSRGDDHTIPFVNLCREGHHHDSHYSNVEHGQLLQNLGNWEEPTWIEAEGSDTEDDDIGDAKADNKNGVKNQSKEADNLTFAHPPHQGSHTLHNVNFGIQQLPDEGIHEGFRSYR